MRRKRVGMEAGKQREREIKRGKKEDGREKIIMMIKRIEWVELE